MKRVVSVSIGSAKRNHRVELEVLGQTISLERIGTDGDLDRARAIMAELDGKVDAIGLGGISFYLYAGGRRYVLRDALRLVSHVKRTPVLDGSGIKNTLEARLPKAVEDACGFSLAGQTCLMVNTVERYALAKALVESGCRMTFGDLIFSFGLPFPLYSLRAIDGLGRMVLPLAVHLPFKMLYPTGKEQEQQIASSATRFLAGAKVIAGDYHYIRRHMPLDMGGKVVITNTVTEADRVQLAERGVSWLATASPDFAGRSFATNVLEALIVAVSGRNPEELKAEDFYDYAMKLGIQPRIERLSAQ
ncbi:MAG: quinate 5-dehydrogenase [Bacteroidota bacterium]